jgi:hypothetical protein
MIMWRHGAHQRLAFHGFHSLSDSVRGSTPCCESTAPTWVRHTGQQRPAGVADDMRMSVHALRQQQQQRCPLWLHTCSV